MPLMLAEQTAFLILPDLEAGRAVAASAVGPSPIVAATAPAKAVAILNDLLLFCFSSGRLPAESPASSFAGESPGPPVRCLMTRLTAGRGIRVALTVHPVASAWHWPNAGLSGLQRRPRYHRSGSSLAPTAVQILPGP